ncbi:MAG TPA: cytochrome c oxidase subunit II [Pirellulaceae bacterium]|nr:cytochrome c oxidase subunit II [Pirellulaceae bacterium]HMO91365.1 cytochrome c oxidase subunit II [Pirellulaceae bacterium]HMP70243.1 cytochrome c oxidase subunit II [Pirellulaceae bacterium]
MKWFWAVLFLSMPVAAVVIYVGSAFNVGPLESTWMPPAMSEHAHQIDHLFNVFNLILAVVLGVTGVILFIALLRTDLNKPAKFVRGHVGLELGWTLVPAGVLVFLAMYQANTWRTNKMERPVETPVARVIARQFEWDFYYPGPDGLLATADDLYSINRLVVPVNRQVVLELSSDDVIHSFSVPKLRLKQDIVPGTVHRVWFRPTQIGDLEIVCAELCGWGHYNMRATLSIVSPDEYERWIGELRATTSGEGQ